MVREAINLTTGGAIDSWGALFRLLGQILLLILQALVKGDVIPGGIRDAIPGLPGGATGTGDFVYPLSARGTISQRFGRTGFSDQSGWYGAAGHTGIDIAVAGGTVIRAADSGTVTLAGLSGGYGYAVKIDHGDGLVTLYGHMRSKPPVRVGQSVRRGDTIGYVGSTGLSTGNHLHFEVIEGGVYKNPALYVDF